jgi:hypothetical protein
MRRIAAAIDRYWMAPAPADRLGAVRLLVGLFAVVYLAIRTPHILSYTDFPARQFARVGLLALVSGPPPAWPVYLVTAIALLSGVGFTLGWRFWITGPLFAAALLAVMTYINSWGQIFHTENLMVLYVVVLGLVRSADGWSLDARGGPAPAPDGRYGWPLRLMTWVLVAAYFLAGVAKLRSGGASWAGGDVLRDTIAADSLRKIVLGSSHSPLAEVLLDQAWLFRGLAALTLVVEIGAPLALLGGRILRIWIAAVIAFHLGVLALMTILFPFPILGVAFAPALRAERFVGRVAAWVRRRQRRGAAPGA